MIFRRLVELHQTMLASGAYVRGLAVSAAAHLLVVGGWVESSRGTEASRPAPEATFTPVEYLIPKQKLVASRPQQETITFTTLTPSASGHGFAESAPAREEPKLEVEVAKGDSNEVTVAQTDLLEQAPIPLGDSIKTELEVDSTVMRYDDSAAPEYPPALLRRRIEGFAVVQYVVDTAGRADTATFRVVTASHPEFALAVRATLPKMRFRPAFVANKRVAQLVQQPFSFCIVDTTTTAGERPRRPPF